jgi:hypothetical protein
MGRFTVRRGLVLVAALLAGGALTLPFASPANSSAPTGGGTTGTTGTTQTTGTGTTSTTPATTPTGTTSTTPTGTTSTGTTSTTPTAPRHPPHIAGESAERIGTTSAVVKATVNPEGLATTYRIQYGLTAAYGPQTGSAAVGSGTAEVKLTHTIGSLAPNTTYHYRLVASSSAGATLGADATFTTAKLAPTLTASVTPGPVAFGRPLMLAGNASGPESAGVEVVAQENPYPYNRGFEDITSPQTVDGGGNFSFPLLGLFESAQLRVATAGKPLAYSTPVGELVTVRVTLHAHRLRRRGYVRLYGTVTPSEPGARVAFERWRHGRYAAASGTRIKGPAGTSSRFARIVRIHRGGSYRALVKLAGGALASGRSAPVMVR